MKVYLVVNSKNLSQRVRVIARNEEEAKVLAQIPNPEVHLLTDVQSYLGKEWLYQ